MALPSMSMTDVRDNRIQSVARGPGPTMGVTHEYTCTGQWIGTEPVFALADSVGRLSIYTPTGPTRSP
jgi:hypothetical protein